MFADNNTNLNIDVGHGQLQVREDTRNKLRQYLLAAAERPFVIEVRKCYFLICTSLLNMERQRHVREHDQCVGHEDMGVCAQLVGPHGRRLLTCHKWK